MPDKKPPLWKQLGYTRVKNEKGAFLGYKTPEGDYIPRRQYDKLQGKPGKGSPGYSERTDVTPRKVSPRTDTKAYKDYAKRPGATLEGFKNGGEKEVPHSVYSNQRKHFDAVQRQRFESIQLKYDAGLISRAEWGRLRTHAWTESETREKMADIWEKLDRNSATPGGRQFTDAEREALEVQYRKLKKKYDHAHRQLQKAGVVPERGTDLEHGYYH